MAARALIEDFSNLPLKLIVYFYPTPTIAESHHFFPLFRWVLLCFLPHSTYALLVPTILLPFSTLHTSSHLLLRCWLLVLVLLLLFNLHLLNHNKDEEKREQKHVSERRAVRMGEGDRR